MRQNCCAYNCKQKTGQGVSFHSFPKGRALREKWIFNMRWANWKPGVSSKICDNHFEPDCFLRTPWSKRKTLKPKAVPTIFNFPDKGNKSTPRKPPKDRNSSTQKTFEQQNQITSQPVGNIFIETNDTELENIMVMPDIHFTPASSPLSNCSPSPQLPEQEIKPKIETIQNTTPKIESIQNIILETPNTTLENVFIVPDIVSPEFSPLSIPNPSSSTHESKDSKIICIDDFDENNIWHYSTDVLIPLVKAIKYSNAKKDHEINMLKERLRLQEKKIEYLNSMIKHLTGGTE